MSPELPKRHSQPNRLVLFDVGKTGCAFFLECFGGFTYSTSSISTLFRHLSLFPGVPDRRPCSRDDLPLEPVETFLFVSGLGSILDKQHVDMLEGQATGFRVEEEAHGSRDDVEDREDNVCLVTNILQRGRSNFHNLL